MPFSAQSVNGIWNDSTKTETDLHVMWLIRLLVKKVKGYSYFVTKYSVTEATKIQVHACLMLPLPACSKNYLRTFHIVILLLATKFT